MTEEDHDRIATASYLLGAFVELLRFTPMVALPAGINQTMQNRLMTAKMELDATANKLWLELGGTL